MRGRKKDYLNKSSCFMLIWVFGAILAALLTPQLISVTITHVGAYKLLLGFVCAAIGFLILYAALHSCVAAGCMELLLSLLLGTANAYVYRFRGSSMMLYDLASIRTAINVLPEYSLRITPVLALVWFLDIGWMAIGLRMVHRRASLRHEGIRLQFAQRLLAITGALLLLLLFLRGSDTLAPKFWENQAVRENGYILDLFLELKQMRVKKPEGYSSQRADEIRSQAAASYSGMVTDGGELAPNIIVIVDESFADFSHLGDRFRANREVMPYLASIREGTGQMSEGCQAFSGFTLASVYGGFTANTEYEFLTSQTMAFLPEGSIPYLQYVKQGMPSLVSRLKEQGYTSIAMHPYRASGWERPAVYQKLGFDEALFEPDFKGRETLRNFISDRGMYDKLIEVYEEKKASDSPLFLYGVTMQNHGAYDYRGDNFHETIQLEGYDTEIALTNQYLSLLAESDQALSELTDYFSSVEERVVLLFFGDHYANADPGICEAIHGGDFLSIEEEILRYETPYLLWTNFDFDTEPVEKYLTGGISMNYLAPMLLRAAGLPLDEDLLFLEQMKPQIPKMNRLGYQSSAVGHFVSYEDTAAEEAGAAEKELLQDYQVLQYDWMHGCG